MSLFKKVKSKKQIAADEEYNEYIGHMKRQGKATHKKAMTYSDWKNSTLRTRRTERARYQ